MLKVMKKKKKKVQLKGISAIREAFCTGIQLLIRITDAERAESDTYL